MILFLVRHGVTEWNDARRYLGHSDLPLSTRGQMQAECLAKRLRSETFDAIYSSDLQRSVATAESIASAHGLSIQQDGRLREMNFGLFEGLTYEVIQSEHSPMAAAWFADPECPPSNGERLSDMNTRVIETLTDILAGRHECAVIVAHGGSLRLMLCHLLGLSYSQYWRFHLEPCAITQINVYDSGGILMRLNDICHLHEITS